MVLYFVSRAPENYMIYMGKDKFENEQLIAYGFPEDIWFHVDDLSSAHVYLRLPRGKTIHDIPEGVLEDCTQLVKHNSISGCKLPTVSVVYTPWSNLKKTQGMEVGQVGFHDESLVIKYKVQKKLPQVVKNLLKSKEEKDDVDLKALFDARDGELRREERIKKEEAKRQEKQAIEENKKKKELQSYAGFMDEEKMSSNKAGNAEDDFW